MEKPYQEYDGLSPRQFIQKRVNVPSGTPLSTESVKSVKTGHSGLFLLFFKKNAKSHQQIMFYIMRAINHKKQEVRIMGETQTIGWCE